MKHLAFLLLLPPVLVACELRTEPVDAPSDIAQETMEAAANPLTAEEQAEGWHLLFDGQTLGGWHGYGQSRHPGGWQVADGALHLPAGAGGGDIVSDAAFGDFELRLEWKVAPCGNSGI